MAETCIVCLGDLALHDEGPPTATEAPIATDNGADNDNLPTRLEKATTLNVETGRKEEETIAHLLPCGHNLHNDCLKPWVERANSCPICRANFNMVELSARIGGM
jgi:hypothetical protein